jgi:hypothetical protein
VQRGGIHSEPSGLNLLKRQTFKHGRSRKQGFPKLTTGRKRDAQRKDPGDVGRGALWSLAKY